MSRFATFTSMVDKGGAEYGEGDGKQAKGLAVISNIDKLWAHFNCQSTGAMYGIRTRDHWNHNPVLYQLS